MIEREDVQKIRELAEDLVEDHGWATMDLDLRELLTDHGLPCGDEAQRKLADHAVWLLS